MVDDIIINKTAIIHRCLARIREVYDHDSENLHDITKQDSIILNLHRACEASIDLAMHIVSIHQLGIPNTSREAFQLLGENQFLDRQLSERMQKMVGFRNVAIHDYQRMQVSVLQAIIENHLSDFTEFTEAVRESSQ
ncbi:type VII toxin-antitoxin system HepT family RNase toxin [Natribacillus halophilus]|uniref:Uncharacterized conserved protein YutE, UPF0331/DUF86 family n=1 Tax=Natribacillus halophilus TaxID=549003 RepID=A0A1G8S9K8_9BACI|nr:DUF86 domain-containing protein [Natribacillus halophilus]SDJ25884.1 Uncharacterized conserved protein YutE, UPF0331/DUF86 family [Natribacillus halophilus]